MKHFAKNNWTAVLALAALAFALFAFFYGAHKADDGVTSATGGSPRPGQVVDAPSAPLCPTGQVLVGDGYAPSVCHRFDTLPPDEKQAAGNFPCPASQTVEIVNVGTWQTRCAS